MCVEVNSVDDITTHVSVWTYTTDRSAAYENYCGGFASWNLLATTPKNQLNELSLSL